MTPSSGHLELLVFTDHLVAVHMAVLPVHKAHNTLSVAQTASFFIFRPWDRLLSLFPLFPLGICESLSFCLIFGPYFFSFHISYQRVWCLNWSILCNYNRKPEAENLWRTKIYFLELKRLGSTSLRAHIWRGPSCSIIPCWKTEGQGTHVKASEEGDWSHHFIWDPLPDNSITHHLDNGIDPLPRAEPHDLIPSWRPWLSALLHCQLRFQHTNSEGHM